MVGASSGDDKISNLDLDLFLGQIFFDNASEVWAELKETYDKLDGLLARETLTDMKDAFAIMSREESHRGIASTSSGSVGHTVDRCFDIIGYPLGYNKNPSPKPNDPRTFNANFVSSPYEKGASLSFTNEQMMRLMNLINEAPSGSVQANMARNLLENLSQGQPDLRRSSKVLKIPAKFNDYVVNNSKNEPTSYFEVVKNPNWIEVMNNEIEALNRNNTWTVCDLSVRKKAMGSKWLRKIKCKSTSEIKRYKARVVVKGFSQREGFDYLKTFSHVVKMSTVMYVYMTLPPGFDTDKSKVCKLNKSLYGLKQASRLGLIISIVRPDRTEPDQTECISDRTGPKTTDPDRTVPFRSDPRSGVLDQIGLGPNSDNVFIILLVYVDDIVVTRNNLNEIEKFKQFLNQRRYCLELLHEFGLLAAKHVDTPLPGNATLNHIESEDDHLLVNVSNYQRLVGSGIQINKTGNLKLRTYADFDWARCPATRKFVSGYCVFLGDSLITWKSKKQSTLSSSSAKAEYRSMASATCEVIWLSNFLGDMSVKNLLPVVMYCDNSSALQIAANPVFHEKSKQFEIDVHLVREKVSSGVIKTEKIHTTQQIADILTKGLDIEQHKILFDKLGMLDMFKLEKT
nr:hypothetical protein [Tanacetum cinerariifolium]